jgi:hypothetical protein
LKTQFSQITLETRDIFIEVTSSKNPATCKKVMEMLLSDMLKIGISAAVASGDEFKQLTVKQTKILGVDGNVKTLYPSKVDLTFAAKDNIIVERL